ncbi:GDSL-type esterase/lipase family protein [Niveibacterium sp. 24ML]|uniref:GDSL-type esterase/lipase family protein n=1 Tax=Niveibacterium sp. 24ML TaxID=2985512 RepID=UPI00226F9F14|nr:GDSL-type esterase/lipase family protein [Niveibacterium sp. 24ML]MCX9156334.1 GDSL-type esterase/lipase family protein [Niveibacterium sp. 24ML]
MISLMACGGSVDSSGSAESGAAPMRLEAPAWLNTGVRVMALGDSLTEGWPAPYGGFRFELYRRFIAANLPVDFVGSLSNTSEGLPDKAHEGHGGWTSYDLRDGRRNDPNAGSVASWLAAAKPDVILLLAGTNDVFNPGSDEDIAANLLSLVDRVRALAPEAELFVGSTPPLRESALNARINHINAIVQPGLATRMALDPRLHFVPTNGAISSADLDNDGVHMAPEGAGNAKLADAWLAATRATLERLNAR